MSITPGVYAIIFHPYYSVYIGSSVDVEKRKMQHFSELSRNKHSNALLQEAYNSFKAKGLDNGYIEFYVLEECAPESLTEREQFWIDMFLPDLNIAQTAGQRSFQSTPMMPWWKRAFNIKANRGKGQELYRLASGKKALVLKALKANPSLSSSEIAEMCNVTRQYVNQIKRLLDQ